MRKIIKAILYVLCGLFLLLILAGIISIIQLFRTTPTLSYGDMTNTDPWLACYHAFSIIGSIGTLAAVIVALFKEELMRWINSPDLNFTLIGNGLTANNDSQVGTTPDSYECYIRITNQGSNLASGCKAFLQSIRYNKNNNTERLKPITNIQKKKQLQWTSSSVDIPVDIPSEIMLFQILNPNQLGTPQGGNVSQKPQIVLNGCQLNKNCSEKGLWEIEYYITMGSGNVSKFMLTINWDGTWCDNEEDMLDKVKIQLKKL